MKTKETDPTKESVHVFRPYPSIDQEYAFCVVLMSKKLRMEDLDGVHFNDATVPYGNIVRINTVRDQKTGAIIDPGQIVENTWVLDVDAVERYKDSNHGTATMMQAEIYGLQDLPGLHPLCAMLRDNNGLGEDQGRGGYLKRLPREYGPFAQLLRYVQKMDLAGVSDEDRLERWIDAFQDVCRTYFAYAKVNGCDAVTAPTLTFEQVLRFMQALPDLADRLAIDRFYNKMMKRPEALLTLTGYVVASYSLMTPEEWDQGGERALVDKAEFWISAFEEMAKLEERAEEKAEEIANEIFAFLSGKPIGKPHEVFNTPAGRAVYVQTDMNKAAAPLWRLLDDCNINTMLVQKQDGRTAVLTRAGAGVDLDPMAEAVMAREPDGRWALERRLGGGEAPALLNGSDKIDKEPTALTKTDLIAIAKETLRLRPRHERASDRHDSRRPTVRY